MTFNWQRKRLKYCVDLINDKIEGESSPSDYLGLEGIESGTGKLLPVAELTMSDGVVNRYSAGDVLFSKLRPYLAKVVDAVRGGVCTSELLVLRPRLLHHRYLFYALLNPQFIEIVNSSTYGSKMPRANWEFIGDQLFLLPPQREQHAIAAFLDRKTAEIDAVIAKKERLIALLQEERQALISRAVTRGLDPGVAMKDSGIPWLGEVPRHWGLMPLGYLAAVFGGSTPSKDNLQFWDGTIPWVSPKDMKRWLIGDAEDHVTDFALQETSLVLIQPPAVLMVVRGMILAHTVPVALTTAPVTINQDMKALLPNNRLHAPFLAHLLRAMQPALLAITEESGHGTQCLRTELWQKLRLPLPPLAEQEAICSYIERAVSRIDGLFRMNSDQITKLREYRQALISAAVTGKLAVPQEVAT